LDNIPDKCIDEVLVLYQLRGIQVTNGCRGTDEVAVVDVMIVVERIAKNMSWPKHPIALKQGDVGVGTMLGAPFVVKVVRNTAVEVLEYATAIKGTLGSVIATAAMLSNAVV
jgi:hypothetical protein